MTHVRLRTPDIDVDQMRAHINELHGPEARGELALCWTPGGEVRGRFHHAWGPWSALNDGFNVEPGYWRTWLQRGQRNWQFYITLGTYRFAESERPARRQDSVVELPGVWLDLDVKPGVDDALQSVTELEELVSRLPPATMRVNTGTGGAHLYWLLERDKRLKVAGKVHAARADDLLEGWLALGRHHANGRTVDHVHDRARVLRVAGSVRWRRTSESSGESWSRVELAHVGGPRYPLEELEALALPHLARERERERELREAFRRERREALDALERVPNFTRERHQHIENTFNRSEDWAELLGRAGWTLHSDCRDHHGSSACRYWLRPGKEIGDGAASASTDYAGSDLITFFSSGVPDLDRLVTPGLSNGNNRGATTKYRFALIALYDNNEPRLIADIVRGGGRLVGRDG